VIRVVLPFHLQALAHCDREVSLEVTGAVTQRSVLDALEARYPMLRGTVREHLTLQRRPRLRFFANNRDVTHESPDAELPASIASGEQPLRIVGAVAGG
jgi:molybdopterin synthase sulfur carrier subunit